MNPNGRKEITEAVTIAALSAVVAGAITWVLDECKRHVNERRAAKAAKPSEPTEAPK